MSGRLSPGMAELKRLYDEAGNDNRRAVIRLLAYIKGCWYRQPIDTPTVNVWVDVLWDIEFVDAKAAAREYFETDSPDPSPPTPFQIRVLALAKRVLRLREQKQLVAPGQEVGLTPEEREAGLKVLREAIKKAGK